MKTRTPHLINKTHQVNNVDLVERMNMKRLGLLLKVFLFTIMLYNFLSASTTYDILVKRYDYDINSERFVQIGNTLILNNLTADIVVDQFRNSSDLKRIEFYIPINDTRFSSKFNTLQSKLLTDSRNNSEFTPVSLTDYQYRFFIGFASKNFGIFTGWLLTKGIYKDSQTGGLYTRLVAEKINWLNYFTDKTWSFYDTYKTAPLVIFNTFSFLNAVNRLANNHSLSEDVSNINSDLNDTYVYDDPGVLRFNSSVFSSKNSIRDLYKNMDSHKIFSGTKTGWSVNSDTGKLFRDNGYTIVYPYADPDTTVSVAAAIFANFMNDRQVLSGYIITDEPMNITTKTWRSGKGGKRIHVQKDIFINSSAIDIKHLTIVRPFREFTASLSWRDSQFSYATVINPFPSENPFILKITPEGHMTTHGFKQTSDLGDLGDMHISREISWQKRFNWLLFALISVVLAVAAIYTFGATFSAFGSWAMTGAVNSTQYLIMSIAGQGAMMSLAGVTASFVTSTFLSYIVVSNLGGGPSIGGVAGGNSFYNSLKQIVEDRANRYTSDVIKFDSTNAKFITIPSIVAKSDPVTLISTKKYLELLNTLQNTGDLTKLNENAFFKEYGSYGNYLLYENREAADHQIWGSEIAENFYKLYQNIFSFKPAEQSDLTTAVFGTPADAINYNNNIFMNSRKAMVYLLNRVWGI